MDTAKVGNNKYFHGKYADAEATRGWFVGSFLSKGHPCKTKKIEIQFAIQEKGHICKKHYHKEKIEINIILDGKVNYWINEDLVEIGSGEFIFVKKNNIVKAEFLEKTKLFSIHSPSIPTDKIMVGE